MSRPIYLDDPFDQFQNWYQKAKDALNHDSVKVNAVSLATADREGRPSSRMVYYRGQDPDGFLIYTNYGSRKGQELLENPFAAILFHWDWMTRQVRIEGKVHQVSYETSNRYWQSRPRESQLSALASEQSREITGYGELKKKVEALREEYEGKEVPCPEFWGGFCVVPDRMEFWQAGEYRLHRRVSYQKTSLGWDRVQLAP